MARPPIHGTVWIFYNLATIWTVPQARLMCVRRIHPSIHPSMLVCLSQKDSISELNPHERLCKVGITSGEPELDAGQSENIMESIEVTSAVEVEGIFVENKCLLASEADFSYYVLGMCSKLLKYKPNG